jgi:hypothetical protein
MVARLALVGLLGTTLLLSGCVSMPAIVSSDSFSGTVYEGDTNQPVPGIFIYAYMSTGIGSWDNSGRGGGSHILCQDYAISDSQGNFTFPSLLGATGFAFYSFGEYRDLNDKPCFSLWGKGYSGSGDFHAMTSHHLDVFRSKNTGANLFIYLDGEKKLSFRRGDYPQLLVFLNQWWQEVSTRGIPDAREKRLYEEYREVFSGKD